MLRKLGVLEVHDNEVMGHCGESDYLRRCKLYEDTAQFLVAGQSLAKAGGHGFAESLSDVRKIG